MARRGAKIKLFCLSVLYSSQAVSHRRRLWLAPKARECYDGLRECHCDVRSAVHARPLRQENEKDRVREDPRGSRRNFAGLENQPASLSNLGRIGAGNRRARRRSDAPKSVYPTVVRRVVGEKSRALWVSFRLLD